MNVRKKRCLVIMQRDGFVEEETRSSAKRVKLSVQTKKY